VLVVIQHDQHVLQSQRIYEAFQGGLARLPADSQRRGNGRWDLLLIGDRGQLRQPDPVA
jgi:hypothetical protein